jgi:hypothetical protein
MPHRLQKTQFLKITAIPPTEGQAGSIVELKTASSRNEKLQFFDSGNVHNLGTTNPHEFVLRQLLLERNPEFHANGETAFLCAG